MDQSKTATENPLRDTEDHNVDGLSTNAIIGIGVGCGVVVVVFAIIVIWRICSKKQANNRPLGRNSSTTDQVDGTGLFKLPTLGNHYKISSVLTIISNNERKQSLAEERKFSDISNPGTLKNGKFHDNKELIEIQTKSNNSPEVVKLIHKQTLSACSSKESIIELTESEPNMDGLILKTSRNRQESTYIEVTPPDSRRSSQTSDLENLHFQKESQFIKFKNAPLATQDSIPSLPAKSRDRLYDSSKPVNPRIDTPKFTLRPSSEGMLDDGIPSLPTKKYTRTAASTSNVKSMLNPNPHQKKGGVAKYLQVSKSANCIFDSDEDDVDVDDRPSQPLPPKQIPVLPPKQRINKSSEALQQIDTNFKKSLTELRQNNFRKSRGDESTDIDYEEPTPSVKIVESKTAITSNGKHSPTDSDDPPDYDEPPDEPYIRSKGKAEPRANSEIVDRHEFEDYDEPIHHSSFA